jgi:predicted nuclease of predicted toxin-antitoxin system
MGTGEEDGYVILTKDSDFEQRSFLYGAPPKVVWLRAGNTSPASIRTLINAHWEAIEAFVNGSDAAIMVIPALIDRR